jgi:divalent metal cation (Fe/Co/Zn/Cd) transporter
MHIIVDGAKTVKEAHDLTHQIQDTLKEKYEKIIELICHIEPDELNEYHHLIHDKLMS